MLFMAKKMYYPDADKIIHFNVLALRMIKVKKADKALVMSHAKIQKVVDGCMTLEGDVYDKAVLLLRELIQQHPFASGNRRTAFIVMKDFLLSNNVKLAIKDDPLQARILQGIRERYYTDEELKEWIQYGVVKSFER